MKSRWSSTTRTRKLAATKFSASVARLSKLHALDEAEWAIIISDQWQGHGLGTKLLRLLVEVGRKEKLSRLIAHILPDNTVMQHISKKAGFQLHFDRAAGEWRAELML